MKVFKTGTARKTFLENLNFTLDVNLIYLNLNKTSRQISKNSHDSYRVTITLGTYIAVKDYSTV